MANTPIKKVRKPKKQKVKQGHKLVWLTLVIILIPVLVVGYVLFTSASGNDKPVEGKRFSSSDLNPAIDNGTLESIRSQLLGIDGVESATINLASATVRIHLNMVDGLDDNSIHNAAETAYNIVNSSLPIDTYFTDTATGKNYDLEIDSFNYIVDNSHPLAGQIYYKITKNGAGNKVVENINQPKNPELAEAVRNHVYDTSLVSDFGTEDVNGDGVVDEKDVATEDLNGDGVVDANDVPKEDVNGDGVIDANDITPAGQ